MLTDYLWRAVALLCSLLAGPIIARAKRTPYVHLAGYMKRWWLFNAYQASDEKYIRQGWLMSRLPSVRVHCILRPDTDDHLHDHPWEARTIILRGAYWEELEGGDGEWRQPGDTKRVRYGEFHRIGWVEPRDEDEGVYTLFFTWGYIGTWGFKVNGVKVPWRDYLKVVAR